MGKAYVSEFTGFMNQYLDEHPEVVDDQRRGWEFFWKAKVDLTTPDITRKDRAPDDSYGFAVSAWRADAPGVKKPAATGKPG